MNILRVYSRLQMGFALSRGFWFLYMSGRQKEGISIVTTRFKNFQFRKLRETCSFVWLCKSKHFMRLNAIFSLRHTPLPFFRLHSFGRLQFISHSHLIPTHRHKPDARMTSYTSSAILIAYYHVYGTFQYTRKIEHFEMYSCSHQVAWWSICAGNEFQGYLAK